MSTPHLARMQRLADLSAKPRVWLAAVLRENGWVDALHPLEAWSTHELAVEVLNLEQKANR